MNSSLFEALSMGHPERLVQGAFGFALQHQPRLVKHLLTKLELEPKLRVRRVTHEQKTAVGWRADTKIEFEDGTTLLVELKLAAQATANQKRAAKAGVIHAAIVPTGTRFEHPNKVKTLEWSDIAKCVKGHDLLVRLFDEADASASWVIPTFTRTKAEESFTGFCKSERWPGLYRFLSTVSQHLSEDLSHYNPSRGWSWGRASFRYYGFEFGTHTKGRFWVGFVAAGDETTPVFKLRNESLKAEPKELKRWAYPLSAKSIAHQIKGLVAK